MSWPRWRSSLVLAGFTGLAVCTLIPVSFPNTGVGRALGVVFPVSEPYAHTAERALSVGDAHTASAATLRELSVSPLAEDAWVRLARIDESEHAHLTTRGDEALQHAYDALPYDAGPGTQRSNFVLTHFDELSPALREQVGEELHVWARSGALRAKYNLLRAQPWGASASNAISDAFKASGQ